MCRIADKIERREALEKNWNMLQESFPDWHKNRYLKALRTKKGFFMRSMNRVTYSFYSWFFANYYKK